MSTATVGSRLSMRPRLDYAFSVWLELDHTYVLRTRDEPMLSGNRYGLVTVTGGRFEGPRFRGRVLPGGGDYPTVRRDGYPFFDARYILEEEDGTLIRFRNLGLREPAPPRGSAEWDASAEALYFRTFPVLDAPVGPHDWVSRTIFVGTGRRTEEGNRIDYFQLAPELQVSEPRSQMNSDARDPEESDE